MAYARPQYKEQFENFIGGEWLAPKSGEYFDKVSPVDGKILTRIPRSNEADVDAAVAAGVNGVFVESHQDPDNAPSDGPNMIPLDEMQSLLTQLSAIHNLCFMSK